jgi:hypothetical protein
MKRDGNYNMSPVAGGRLRPAVIADRVKVGDDGPPKERGIVSMTPIAGAPHERRTARPLSPDIRRQLENFPEQRARIREVERRK